MKKMKILKVFLICFILSNFIFACTGKNKIRQYHIISMNVADIEIDPGNAYERSSIKYLGKITVAKDLAIKCDCLDDKEKMYFENLGAWIKKYGIDYTYIVSKKSNKRVKEDDICTYTAHDSLFCSSHLKIGDKKFWYAFENGADIGVNRRIIDYRIGEEYYKNSWKRENKSNPLIGHIFLGGDTIVGSAYYEK